MDRRKFNSCSPLLIVGVLGLYATSAPALTLDQISQTDAAKGLKLALERGTRQAIGQLGQLDGYLGNEKVRIPLPPQLQEGQSLLRRLGQGRRLDELVTSMNRAAETAVPLAQQLMLDAVRGMSIDDARKILRGDETSATRFFADKTRAPLTQQFLPVVTRTTDKVGLAAQYNRIAQRAAGLGLLRPEEASIQQYVTGKALDGLYLMVGEEERRIRRDPVGTGSALLRKVFGALK